MYPISYITHFLTLPRQPTKKQTDSYNFTFSFPPTSISALQKTLNQTHLLLLLLFSFFPTTTIKHNQSTKRPSNHARKKKSHPNIYMWYIYIYLREQETDRQREKEVAHWGTIGSKLCLWRCGWHLFLSLSPRAFFELWPC